MNDETQIDVLIPWIGREEVTVDEAGRLFVPARWRKGLCKLVGVPWLPGPNPTHISLFMPEEWSKLMRRLGEMCMSDPVEGNIVRHICANAYPAILDKVGRIRLPRELLEKVGILTKAVMIGLGYKFELWSPENYARYVVTNPPSQADFQNLRIG